MFDDDPLRGGAGGAGGADGVAGLAGLVGRLGEVVSALCSVSLTGLSRDELLGVVTGFEGVRRRLSVVDHRLVAETDRRGVCHELCEPSTRVLLAKLLRLDPGEAKGRVDAARDLGPRMDTTGQRLEPILSVVAAAQAAGVISPGHARVVAHAVAGLPAAVAAVEGERVEAVLTEQAGYLSPGALGQVARVLGEYLDPDGALADDGDHERRREVTLTARRDGSGYLKGILSPQCLARWQAITDSLAVPRPGVDGVRDPRTAGQRVHDAFDEAAQRLLRSGSLPDTGGVPVTVLITATAEQIAAEIARQQAERADDERADDAHADRAGDADDAEHADGVRADDDGGDVIHSGDDDVYGGDLGFGSVFGRPRTRTREGQESRDGLDGLDGLEGLDGLGGGRRGLGFARTAHGGQVSVAALLGLADEALVFGVVSGYTGGVLSYGRTKRFPTAAQRCVLTARDGGCSFPECTVPPGWCQAHHIRAWLADGDAGPTDIDNLTLLCGYHHRMFLAAQWECLMIAGIPHWRPPAWLDPDRVPRRNTAHHPDIHFRDVVIPERAPDTGSKTEAADFVPVG